MSKKVVVIASGLTEREALPHLTRHLAAIGVSVVDVRIPPRNRPLIPRLVQDLIKAIWWDMHLRGNAPDKFVVLIDADGKLPAAIIPSFQEACAELHNISATCLVATAQWHLEAWFFAHAESLREFLGKSSGSVDTSAPDEIVNPKLHLKHLLGRPYTALTAGAIASGLNPEVIRTRSPSFAEFEASLKNGGALLG